MRHLQKMWLTASTGALVLAFGVACGGDSAGTGPTLQNPAAVQSAVQSIGTTFSGGAFTGFQQVAGAVDFSTLSAPPVLGRMKAILAAARPREPLTYRTAKDRYAARVLESRKLQSLLPILVGKGMRSNAAIIPAQALGKTFEWDPNSLSYGDLGTTGAPADGVRIIVYAIDPLQGIPSTPLTPVGALEVRDLNPAGTSAAGLNVHLFSGGTDYADYDIGATYDAVTPSFTATATGFLDDGSQNHLDFGTTVTVSPNEVSYAVPQFDLDINGTTYQITQAYDLTFSNITDGIAANFAIDWSFAETNQTVSIHGLVVIAIDTVAQTITTTADFVVKIGGATYATITFDGTTFVAKNARGEDIQDGTPEADALEVILSAPDVVGDVLTEYLDPAFDLLPGGDGLSLGTN